MPEPIKDLKNRILNFNKSPREEDLRLRDIKSRITAFGPTLGPPGTFKRPEQIPQEGRPFLRDFLPFATEMIPGIASAGGFALGAPVGLAIPGSLAGSILGGEAQTAIRGINPELLGQPRHPLEVAGEDFLGTLLGLGIGKTIRGAAQIPNLVKLLKEDPGVIKKACGNNKRRCGRNSKYSC
ncbi:hypothetical protein LCGC14_1238340 [marine sediment metagenome]|uniref:Uncharacterized protein n=1 Tax=marine sediment metagenome TaxID=412755 RepID=A0A0F9LTQ2_9ZZZZ